MIDGSLSRARTRRETSLKSIGCAKALLAEKEHAIAAAIARMREWGFIIARFVTGVRTSWQCWIALSGCHAKSLANSLLTAARDPLPSRPARHWVATTAGEQNARQHCKTPCKTT